MKLIVIEGCDGTGTSTHTESLAYSLREVGYTTVEFHHPPPPKGCSPWTRVSHYASERSKLVDQYGATDTVVVADRSSPRRTGRSVVCTTVDPCARISSG